MKRAFFALMLAMTLVAAQGLGTAVEARSSSSSGSRSSFSSGSRSSSSGSWSSSSGTSTSKPSSSSSATSGSSGWSSSSGTGSGPKVGTPGTTPPSSQSTSPSGSSWSSSSGTAAKSAAGAAASGSSFSTAGAAGIRKDSSLKAYNDYNARFGKTGNPAGAATGQPLLNPNRTWSSYSDYRADRDRYYSGMGWSPPVYVYHSYPSFGMWDAMFLWMLMSNAHGPSFYYNNQNDPGVQAWRQEAEKLSQSNADLKKQLADMDAKIDQMRKDGVPVKPGQVPEGLDPAMALTADHVVTENPEQPKAGSGWTTVAVVGVIAVAIGGLLILRRSRTV